MSKNSTFRNGEGLRRPISYDLPKRGSVGEAILASAVVGASNIREGMAGLASDFGGLINPNKPKSYRGTPRQKLAALTAVALTGVAGVHFGPKAVNELQDTQGEKLVATMYTNKVPNGLADHDSVLPTRIGWVTDSFGDQGAGVLSKAGIEKIEHVGTYPSKYESQRNEIEDGFTALDRIADIVEAQGRDDKGNVREFDLTNQDQAKLAGLLISYTSDAVNAGLVDEDILGLTPNEILGKYNGLPSAFDRAKYKMSYGNNGSAPVVPGPAVSPDSGSMGR